MDSSINSLEFLESAKESLAQEGILVSQAGVAPRLADPDETYSRNSHRAKFINGLTNVGFERIMTYDIVSTGLSNWGHYIDRIKLMLSWLSVLEIMSFVAVSGAKLDDSGSRFGCGCFSI